MPSDRPASIRLEACVGSAAEAAAAAAGGADRIELCSGLVEGGLTPGPGTILRARALCPVGLMVMVRPRGGDFLYTQEEFEAMAEDIRFAKAAGADGVVFGCLDADGKVDAGRMGALVDLARPLRVTCHRAFDMARDPFAALETLVSLAVDRVLTSGGEATVRAGIPLLARLVAAAAGRIVVMPGGGLRPEDVGPVLAATGATELHFAARGRRESPMRFRNPRPRMGGAAVPGEYELEATEAELVARFVAAARSQG